VERSGQLKKRDIDIKTELGTTSRLEGVSETKACREIARKVIGRSKDGIENGSGELGGRKKKGKGRETHRRLRLLDTGLEEKGEPKAQGEPRGFNRPYEIYPPVRIRYSNYQHVVFFH